LLLHDICKRGYPVDTGKTVGGHPYLVQIVMKDAGIILDQYPYSHRLLKIISTHMGIFDLPFEVPSETLHQIVHLADYIASREFVSIDLED
jgi:hypothetical protein